MKKISCEYQVSSPGWRTHRNLRDVCATPGKSAVELFTAVLFLLVLLFASAPMHAADAKAPTRGGYEGDFFIVTSVNQRMHEIFLKAPTEVTELMLVNNKTVFLDQQGKPITFKDLHAGDTVYVVASKSSGNERVATRVQIGPMTVAILRSRYMK